MSSQSDPPPSTSTSAPTSAGAASASAPTTISTAPSSAASSSTTGTTGTSSTAAGGAGGGGGLGHSAPLRTLLSPTSGMALVHGPGVATATAGAAASTTAPPHQHHQLHQQHQASAPAPPLAAVQGRQQPMQGTPYQQQQPGAPVPPQRLGPTVVAAIPPPPTPIQRLSNPRPQPHHPAGPGLSVRPPSAADGDGGVEVGLATPTVSSAAGAGTGTTAAAPSTPASGDDAAGHAVATPAAPPGAPPPPPSSATTNATAAAAAAAAAAPASAPLPVSAAGQIHQIRQSQSARRQRSADEQTAAAQQTAAQQREREQQQQAREQRMRQPAQPQPPPPTMWAAESHAAASSLEAEVEAFLAGGGGGVSPRRRTSAAAHVATAGGGVQFEGYRSVVDAASRRAWGDVVQLTGDLLGNPASPYQPFYSALLQSGGGTGGGGGDAATATETPSSGVAPAPDLAAAAYGDARLPGEACELVSLRFHALVRLRRYADLGREVEMLNLLPPGGGDSGGMTRRGDALPRWVPYGLKILAAQSLQYTDKPQKCFDTLYTMRDELSSGRADDDDDTQARERMRWIGRVDAALSNAFMRQKEWRLALSALDDLMDILPRCVGWEVDSWLEAERSSSDDDSTRLFVSAGEMVRCDEAKASSAPPSSSKSASAEHRKTLVAVLLSAARIDVLSRQGRVLLQVGALPEADVVFELAKSEAESLELVSKLPPPNSSGGIAATASDMLRGSVLVRQAPTQLVINDGLASFAKERYDAAMDRFQEAVQLQRDEKGGVFGESPLAAAMGVNHVDSCIHPGVGVDVEDCLVAQCLNNMALCALYTCQMLKAVNLIESLIREDPTLFLTEVLAFNLCTLYELGSDNALSGRKKRMVQLIAKKFSLHDIGTESFRIN